MRVERLPNGLRVVLKEQCGKNLIALCGYVNGGGRTEDDTIKGLSHYYEHIIFRGGTARQAELETRRAFQALGDYGGYTNDDATCYYFTVPRENFPEALWRYTDALMNVEVTAEKVERDRQSVIQEYHMSVSDRPWGLAYHNLRRAAYARHPYKVDPIGIEAVIRDAQLDTFRTFYQERYVPNQITIAVVGDFDSDRMLADIEGALGGYGRGRDSFELSEAEIRVGETRECAARMSIELAYFYLGFHAPPARSGDTATLNVMTRLLSGARTARLELALKSHDPVVQDVSAFLEMRRDGSMFTIGADLTPDKQRRAIEVIALELAKLAREGVPEAELERAKRLIENSHYAHYEAYQNQAQGLCWHAVMGEVYDMAAWLPAVRAVSSEDIRRVAGRIFRAENATISTVAPAQAEVEGFAATLAELLPRTTRAHRSRAGEPGPQITELAGGACAIITPDAVSGRFTAMALIAGGQTVEPPAAAGISYFVSQMLMRGTLEKSREALAAEMADHGIEIAISSAQDYTELRLSCAASSRQRALALLGEIIAAPRFDEREIEMLRTEVLTDIEAIGDDSFALAGREFERALYGQHPYGNYLLGARESVARFDREMLADLHRRAYCAPNILLSVAGVTEGIEPALTSLAATLAAGTRTSPINTSIVPLPAGEHFIDKDARQITFNWGRLTLAAGDEDFLALRIATTVISYRLFYRHVYDEGIAYRMWTLLGMRQAPAPFYFQMGVAPENFERARDGIGEEVERMLSEGIPAEEFERALATLTQRYYLAQATGGAQAATYAYYYFYGHDRDFLRDYAARVRAVSKAEVERVARAQIRLEDMVLVAVGRRD